MAEAAGLRLAADAGEPAQRIRHHAPELIEYLDAGLSHDALELFVCETCLPEERLERVNLRLQIAHSFLAEYAAHVSGAVCERLARARV